MPHAPARYRWFVLLGAATLAPLLSSSVARTATPDLQASIRRTEYGIPHIQASNFLGLGYGFGYAFAQDDICVMADDYITVDAQRSRVFGPSGTYAQRGNGVTSSNEDSDLFWQQLIDSGTVESRIDQWTDYRVSVGFGLRFVVPLMGPVPIALDFGFPIVKGPSDNTQVFSFWLGFFR